MEFNNFKIDDYSTLPKLESNTKKVKQDEDVNFNQYLKTALNKVNELQIDAENYKKLLAVGEVDNLHDVAIAAEKANISLQLVLGIRNKVVEAYREIMRMQI